MTMRISIDKSERGWELIYSINNGPWAMGPKDDSHVYSTRYEAMQAAQREATEYRLSQRVSDSDAPHLEQPKEDRTDD